MTKQNETPQEGEGEKSNPAPGQTGTQLVEVEALQKELNEARKEAAGYRSRLKDVEDAGKSEAEKLNDRIAALETATATAQAEALRLRIASTHGITGDDVELFLTGTDEASLTAQAKALAERLGQNAKRTAGVVPAEGSKQTNPLADKPLREVTRRLFDSANSG